MGKSHTTKHTQKRTTIGVGDVLAIPQANDRYTLAYVLGFWPELKAIMSIALLSAEVPKPVVQGEKLTDLITKEITGRRIMAVISTPVPGKKDDWAKIGTATGIDVQELLPAAPFRSGSIVGCKYESAPLVEGLVNAYRGLTDWNAVLPGRPGYLKSLLFERTDRITH